MTDLPARYGIDRRTASSILKRHDVPTQPRELSTDQIRTPF
jgi:hypothetical protein